MQRKLAVDCVVAASMEVVEPIEEEEKEEEQEFEEEEGMEEGKEEEKEEGGSSTKELAPATKQAAMLRVLLPMAPKFCVLCPGSKVAVHGPTSTERAQGKAPATQAGQDPPKLTDEELPCHL